MPYKGSRQRDNDGSLASVLGKIGSAVIAAAVVFSVRSCQESNEENGIAAVNSDNPNAIYVNNFAIEFPDELTSSADGEKIDITNVNKVAEKMGVSLTGAPDQVLYNVTVRSLHYDSGAGQRYGHAHHDSLLTREVPVRVCDVAEYAAIANALEQCLAPGHTSAISPSNFILPSNSAPSR